MNTYEPSLIAAVDRILAGWSLKDNAAYRDRIAQAMQVAAEAEIRQIELELELDDSSESEVH